MDWIYYAIIIAASILLIVLIVSIQNKRYRSFVRKHSIRCKQLKTINNRYNFIKVPLTHLEYDFDHDINFNNVSCSDYLIGYISENMNDILNAINSAVSNRNTYILYKEDVLKIDKNVGFDKEPKLLCEKKLKKYESKYFNSCLLEPVIYFDVDVLLYHYDMGGNFQGRKRDNFKEEEIKKYITRLNNRSGYYYNDNEIWQTLTRYERGKVSLKLRFSIYERDNYTCKRCGKHGYRTDLEIDHIVPISRGGKSTYDNLQTLCHDCNYNKGSKAEKY